MVRSTTPKPVSGCHQTRLRRESGYCFAAGVSGPGPIRELSTLSTADKKITGRTLINDRAICPEIQERVPQTETIRTKRLSLNTLGDGFIEVVADETLLNIRKDQCRSTQGKICGQALRVPVLEAEGQTAVGRFGWKDQHASLLSFSADAYLNEMGITNRLLPNEVTLICNPTSVTELNDQPDPNDHTEDIDHFARFMRASKVPPRDEKLAATPEAQRGSKLFERIGCAKCHVSTLTTAKAGTKVNGGQFTVPDALGEKTFHPYSDFLLHDVGTGDGIAMASLSTTVPAASSGRCTSQSNQRRIPLPPDKINRSGFSYKALDGRNKIRTAGSGTENALPDDARGDSVRLGDAIRRHKSEAEGVTERFRRLTPKEHKELFSFLNSL